MNAKYFWHAICIMLVFGTVSVNAQNFSRSFNIDYSIYGIDLMGYTKALIMRDLTLSDNFISTENRRVTCEGATLNKDGDEYTITLLLNTGISRTARLKAKFKSVASDGRNVLVYLSLYSFSTGETEELDFKGNEQMLERLLIRYVELMDMFYDKSRLLS